MTAYLMTQEQHAQIVEAYNLMYMDTDLGKWDGKAAALFAEGLDLLESLKPVEPVGWQYKTNEAGLFVSDQCPADVEVWNDIEFSNPLYAMETKT